MKVLELQQITKRFGDVVANDAIDLDVEKGEVHCLLGENGAGKTTLMNILSGLYAYDQGSISLEGKPVYIRSPHQAIRMGIGMIHQNFMLAERLTATENIVAGKEPRKGLFLNMEEARKEVRKLSERYGLRLDPAMTVESLSVGEQQRVEILKVLYRDAKILILDEPTSVLTPQEAEELFGVLKSLREEGKTILLITHKLKEATTISDRITVLRDGKKVGTVQTAGSGPEELARMMVGREVSLRPDRKEREPGKPLCRIRGVFATNKTTHRRLKNINLAVREGEIVGVAGVEGNGQLELEEILAGLREIDQGEILFGEVDVTRMGTRQRRKLGLGHIPSDRLRRGLIPSQSVERNLLLGAEWQGPFARKGILSKPAVESMSRNLIDLFRIRCSSAQEKVETLSGGNQQRLIVSRELSREPKLIIASQPTRGVDIGAVEFLHNLLLKLREQGKGILLISAELDEIMSLSDRILVLYEGEIIAEGRAFSEKELGLLMAGQKKGA
jgi:simple sugar transport system ATP-binding protein